MRKIPTAIAGPMPTLPRAAYRRKGGTRSATPMPPREGVDEPPGAPTRLAYRVDEACALLGVSRDTIERAVKAGRLKSGKGLGRRLIDAESLRAMYDDTSEE